MPVIEPREAPLARPAWGVAALLLAAADALTARFGAVVVRGELSGFTRAASGHCYFSLKDADGAAALLRCAMFRRAASLLDFAPTDGQRVELRGRLALYEPRGELQFVAEAMQRVGAGSLYEEFLRLRARLQAEGLFDDARKRTPARLPQRVGIVTSPQAAALRDVLTSFARRAPQLALVLYPAPVQGADAPAALVQALAEAGRRREVDTLLLVRGGGSLEDLWAFNDERVVRAVAASPLPVICGVGHETDITLCDLAADLRAPTPTAAAELATMARDEALGRLQGMADAMQRSAARRLQTQAQRLDLLALRLGRPARALAPQPGAAPAGGAGAAPGRGPAGAAHPRGAAAARDGGAPAGAVPAAGGRPAPPARAGPARGADARLCVGRGGRRPSRHGGGGAAARAAGAGRVGRRPRGAARGGRAGRSGRPAAGLSAGGGRAGRGGAGRAQPAHPTRPPLWPCPRA